MGNGTYGQVYKVSTLDSIHSKAFKTTRTVARVISSLHSLVFRVAVPAQLKGGREPCALFSKLLVTYFSRPVGFECLECRGKSEPMFSYAEVFLETIRHHPVCVLVHTSFTHENLNSHRPALKATCWETHAPFFSLSLAFGADLRRNECRVVSAWLLYCYIHIYMVRSARVSAAMLTAVHLFYS